MAVKTDIYHNLHVRVEMPIWKRLRRMFPEYGALKHVVNRSLEDFIDKYEDLDDYLDKCARLQYDRAKAKKDGKLGSSSGG